MCLTVNQKKDVQKHKKNFSCFPKNCNNCHLYITIHFNYLIYNQFKYSKSIQKGLLILLINKQFLTSFTFVN
jgi:hypothetical protein